MCDVDSVRAGKNFAEFDSKAKFTDYREMFDKMHKSIDAVAISTPDHSHFHPAYIAMDLDKHVYLEKPLQRMFCIETATITGPVYDSWPPDTPFYKTYCEDIDTSATCSLRSSGED